jgi:hypothetical protein
MVALITEAASPVETSANCRQIAQHDTPEDIHLQTFSHYNLKSHQRIHHLTAINALFKIKYLFQLRITSFFLKMALLLE